MDMSKRNPFPFPHLENDNDFTSTKPPQKGSSGKPTHLAQHEEPWRRLHINPTSSSSRRSVTHNCRKVPDDSLDFHLKALYDHHEDFLRTKSETLYQPETLSGDLRRTFKEREKQQVHQNQLLNDSIRVWMAPQKCSIFSMKGTIESHHNTNRGYSRKHDGGFYTT